MDSRSRLRICVILSLAGAFMMPAAVSAETIAVIGTGQVGPVSIPLAGDNGQAIEVAPKRRPARDSG